MNTKSKYTIGDMFIIGYYCFYYFVLFSGGMDDTKLFKYMKSSIMPLYPGACDVPAKRVMIKIDLGLGRLNTKLLIECHIL